jgi:hypothetical protein
MFDHVAQQLAACQVAGVERAPLLQQSARVQFVATFERVLNVGEVVAELAEPQCQVENCHVPRQRRQCADLAEPDVDAPRQQCRRGHRDQPHHGRVVGCASVEVETGPAHPGRERGVNEIVARQRFELLDEQCGQDGKETHPAR